MSLSITLLFFLACLVSNVRSDTFVKPPGPGPYGDYTDNSVYEEGHNISMEWQSSLQNMNLVLYQVYPLGGSGDSQWSYNDTILVNSSDTTLVWNASFGVFSTDFSTDEAGVFYLALYETGNTSLDATSHYFNVTREVTATATLPVSSTTPTSTSQATSSAPSESTSASTESTNSGLSTGAVAGIAVGATIGGIALLGGVAFFVWKRFRGANSRGDQQATPMAEEKAGGIGTNIYYPQTGWNSVHEAPDTAAIHEAPAPGAPQEAPSLRDLHEAP